MKKSKKLYSNDIKTIVSKIAEDQNIVVVTSSTKTYNFFKHVFAERNITIKMMNKYVYKIRVQFLKIKI